MTSAAERQAWHSQGFFIRQLPPDVVAAARDSAVFPDEPPARPDFGSAGQWEFPCGHRAVDMLPFALQDAAIDLLGWVSRDAPRALRKVPLL